MPPLSLSNLGTMVRKKRGNAKLRDTAQVIGISPATLMRVESGRIPDIETFGKICRWLEVDPGSFLGFKSETSVQRAQKAATLPLFVSAHLRADQTPKSETVHSLAKMILLAAQSQFSTEVLKDDEGA
jgi:DNA-binding Xre family transcriptional regulator